jgi:rfaE bifunctional protein nucleotidyltransferase chain/domain
LHPGHVALLQYSKKKGDILVVGLNSDQSVKSLKGDSRPIINENDRAKMLAALECVDFVCIFSETDPQNIITILKPDVHVKGNDHCNETEGVPVTLFFDRVGDYSTTKIIDDQ